MAKAAIFGGSGYTGLELLRLCANHPEIDVGAVAGHSSAGSLVSEVHPSLSSVYAGLVVEPLTAAAAAGCDVAFLALPHGHSQRLVPDLLDAGTLVVDLAADFRLKDAGLYPAWYG